MTRHRHVLVLALSVLAAAIGCSRAIGTSNTLTRHERWALAFSTAQQAAAAGDYVRADTTLLAFARAHPGSPEAHDAVFWRGVLALDPANPRASASTATAAFDEYLRGGPALLRRQEAEVMRRLASRMEHAAPVRQLRVRTASGQTSSDTSAVDPRDEEIRRLREQLKTTTEELERVRRRIATPPPPDTARPPASTPPPRSSDTEQRE